MSFQPTSRYYSVLTVTYEAGDGRLIRCLRRRFLPSPDRFTLLQEHLVAQGDRLDNITARHLGDPEQFWRICDANSVMQPEELEELGRRILITLPEGIPRTPHA